MRTCTDMTKGWIWLDPCIMQGPLFHFTGAAAVFLALLPEGSQVEGMLPNHYISIGCFVFVGEQFPNMARGIAAAIVDLAGQIPGSEVGVHSVKPK